MAVLIEIEREEPEGILAHRRRAREGERTVAGAEMHRERLVVALDHGQVDVIVAIEVRGHDPACPTRQREYGGAVERPVAAAEQPGDAALGPVDNGDDEVHRAVLVDIRRHDTERSAVELTKEWRTDRILRHLEAVLVTVSEEGLLMISGAGDVLEPDDGVIGVGSGGPYALAAAKAFLSVGGLPAEELARRALGIAAEIDIYTNTEITIEEISW